MQDRYLLYIDIVGFSELVASGDPRISDLYEIIANLNVHGTLFLGQSSSQTGFSVITP
jgi:hypothetical protein